MSEEKRTWKSCLVRILPIAAFAGVICLICWAAKQCTERDKRIRAEDKVKYSNAYNTYEQCSREEAVQDYVRYNIEYLKISSSESQFLGGASVDVAIAGNPGDAYFKSIAERADKVFPTGGVYIKKNTKKSRYKIPLNTKFKQVWGYKVYLTGKPSNSYWYIRYYHLSEERRP
jgi:hypothetical protein